MKPTPLRPLAAIVIAGLLLSPVGSVFASDDENSVLTSVFAKTAKDYKRVKDEKGRWEREYYAMSNGGPADGTIRDNAQDKIQFVAIATVLAQHLARQGYFPATDPDKVDFLLVVNWGRTMPFADPTYRDGLDNVISSMNTMGTKNQLAQQARAAAATATPTGNANLTGSTEDMEAQASASYLENNMIIQDMLNRSRNQSNARTATLLGYMGDINDADGPRRYAGGGDLYDELVADIEEARYYIILSAFDFKRTVRESQPKLRWVTRMSMRAPGNSFADKAASMIAYSASRFGQNTDGLERKLYPQYKVNLEDLRFLGIAGWQGPPEAEKKTEQGAEK
ncbi:MAG: hypothetical protein QG602_2159 [Verrucomicrobiota bacterium]|nr:hypothetical protein [Verrucomicrobiota bacterium]